MRYGKVGWVVGALVSMSAAAACGTSGSKPQSVDVAGVQRPALVVPIAASTTTTGSGQRDLFSASTTTAHSPKVAPPKTVPAKKVPATTVPTTTLPPTTVPPTTTTAPPVTTKPTVAPPVTTVPKPPPPTTVAQPKGPLTAWFAANKAKFTALDNAATKVSADMQYIQVGDQQPALGADLTALSKAETAFQSTLASASQPYQNTLAGGVVLLKNASLDGVTAWNYLRKPPVNPGDATTWAFQVRSELYVGMSTITKSLVAGGAPATSVTAHAPPQ